ncbi:recombinase family protein [Candidatus Peregrinibacteria bacterium]|nr:recombinase family protein [Candidatus Peregrinibacteria bacterium]
MKFIVYCRKSTEQEERQALSIPAQLAELRQFAARERLEIVASLCEAQTARKPGRAEYGRMLEMLERGEADGILAWHPDRLARNAIDGGNILHLLDTGKLKALKFPTFWFEPTPQGKFMLAIAFGQSKYYVDNLAENVKRGQREKVRRGEWTWPAPLGYRNNRETRNIESDPETASFVRKTFELYATGNYTLLSLRNELTRLGLRTRKGKQLPVSNLQRMLQYKVYCGIIEMNGEQFQGAFDPIVSKHLFDDVQKVLRQRGKSQRRRKHKFPFIGWLQCATCGCSITAEIQKGHHYYHCTHKRGDCSLRKYAREEIILDEAKRIVEQVSLPDEWSENMLRKLDNEKTGEKSDHRASVQHLNKQLENVEQKLGDLLDLRLEGALDTEEYLAKKNKFIARKVSLTHDLKDAEQNHSNWIEPMRDMIVRSREAKKLLSSENSEAFPAFLKSIGSNFVWNGNAVQWEAARGWRALAESRGFRTWWAGLDSNQRRRKASRFTVCPV